MTGICGDFVLSHYDELTGLSAYQLEPMQPEIEKCVTSITILGKQVLLSDISISFILQQSGYLIKICKCQCLESVGRRNIN